MHTAELAKISMVISFCRVRSFYSLGLYDQENAEACGDMLHDAGGDAGCSIFGDFLLDLCCLGGPLLGLEGQRRVPGLLVFPVQQDSYPCILDRRM